MSRMTHSRAIPAATTRVSGGQALAGHDYLAAEEPLEIRVATRTGGEPVSRVLAVTLRTPGDDLELAVGYLYCEGIIERWEDIVSARVFETRAGRAVARIELSPGVSVDWSRHIRPSFVSSSCGACGKLEFSSAARDSRAMNVQGPLIPAELLHRLPSLLEQGQAVFARTGGLHAAARVSVDGRVLAVREDVGRHNALDKLVGGSVLARSPEWADDLLALSGRIGYELVQKAMACGVTVIAAMGAPSSMAAAHADAAGITLVGFVRDGKFNVYTHSARILAGLTS
jgi:FdhD protein